MFEAKRGKRVPKGLLLAIGALCLGLTASSPALAAITIACAKNECTGDFKICIYNADVGGGAQTDLDVKWFSVLEWVASDTTFQHTCDGRITDLELGWRRVITLHSCISGNGIGWIAGAAAGADETVATCTEALLVPVPGGCGGQSCSGADSCTVGNEEEQDCGSF
jgi:hypothetical protein